MATEAPGLADGSVPIGGETEGGCDGEAGEPLVVGVPLAEGAPHAATTRRVHREMVVRFRRCMEPMVRATGAGALSRVGDHEAMDRTAQIHGV